MINKLFESLKNNKENYLNAKTGNQFEDRIMQYLKMSLGFTRVLKNDIGASAWLKVKKHIVTDKLGVKFIDLPDKNLKKTFVYQPYGSQQFPDFIIFTNKKVVPLEIKFSSKAQPKPIWNSNIPRANAFYVFGSYGLKEITFFCGDNLISQEHRQFLYNFFKRIKKREDEARLEAIKLDATNRGFVPYIRAAFDQKKHNKYVEINYFKRKDRETIEKEAIKKSKTL